VPPRTIGNEQGVDRVGDPDAAARARQLLDHQADVEHAGPLAAVLLGDPDPGEAVRPEGLQDVPAVLAGAVELGGSRADELLGHLAGAVLVVEVGRAQQLTHGILRARRVRVIVHGRRSHEVIGSRI